MQRTITYIVLSVLTAAMLISCNNGESLQGYFVDNQETTNFSSVDVPTTIVNFDEETLTKDQQEAYNSVKRLNFLGYKVKDNNVSDYNAEVTKVKRILNNEKYIDLIEFNDKGAKVIVKYLGDEDVADELIVFASSKDVGFGIVRVLGNDMNPEKMATLVDAVQKADIDASQLDGIMDFFK